MPMGFMDKLKAIFSGGGASAGVATGDPVPSSTEQSDPAVDSAPAGQTPEEQPEAAASDPARTEVPGTEGQDQEPR
jgi:hypothetical protein